MKAILIFPGYRAGVRQLTKDVPLAVAPLLGESLAVYWLVHLASLGAKEVTVMASDRPWMLREAIGSGSRWGLRVHIADEMNEPTVAEARARHGGGDGWLPAPHDVILADHLPGMAGHRIDDNYEAWFSAAIAWCDRAVTPDRTGIREIAPGVRVGQYTVIPDDAVLRAPCWIGEKVRIGSGAIIGPHAIVESRAVVGNGAEVIRSIIGTETMAGEQTEVIDSLALGETLVNWRDGSCLHVPDEYLLCSLRRTVPDPTEWFRRIAQAVTGSNSPMMPVERSPVAHPPI
jgi:NDP-sugar pyrophosphorylase family protein